MRSIAGRSALSFKELISFYPEKEIPFRLFIFLASTVCQIDCQKASII